MEKTIYILQNIENVEWWGVYKTLQEAEYTRNIEVNYLSPDKRAEEDKKWVIIIKTI
jgi:hypothetical protein